MRHVTSGGPTPSRTRFSAFIEDRFGSPARMLYAARQAFYLPIVPPSPVYMGLATALLLKDKPPTGIGLHSAEMLEAVAQSFATRVEELS